MKDWWKENSKPRSQSIIDKISKTKLSKPRIPSPEYILNARNTSTNKKPIIQYSLDLTYINEYPSINEAARNTNNRNDSISACCRGIQKTSGGFIWRYK
jgi:hypothetical protein